MSLPLPWSSSCFKWELVWKLVVSTGALEEGQGGGGGGSYPPAPPPSSLHLAAAAWLRSKLTGGRASRYFPPSGVK